MTPDTNPGSTFGTEVLSGTLQFFPSTNPNPVQSFATTPAVGRYVTFRAEDVVCGQGGIKCGSGLSEIVVYGTASVPEPTTVVIDIKPGRFPNKINPRKHGLIPVAILTTTTFNAKAVDPDSVRFGPNLAAPVHSALKDVNRDGALDLILYFRTQDTGIACGDTTASLTGQTTSGEAIEGSDSVKTVGCRVGGPRDRDDDEEDDD